MHQQYNYPSNNKYFNRAARMEDSSIFTDWRSSGYVNNLLRMKFNTLNDNDYRRYLQNNAISIMQDNTDYYKSISNCDNWKIIPDMTTCRVNPSYMKCAITNSQGVGTRYVAYNS